MYSLRPEQEPIFVFCVDASARALETGFTLACLSAVEAAVQENAVPGGDRARVGVMTFDGSLHAYTFDEEGAVSQMAVAIDTEVRLILRRRFGNDEICVLYSMGIQRLSFSGRERSSECEVEFGGLFLYGVTQQGNSQCLRVICMGVKDSHI